MVATRLVKIKPKNLELIKGGKLREGKLFAYKRLLEKVGSDVENMEGVKMIYVGFDEYIGARFTTYSNGTFKMESFTGKIDN